MNSLWLIRFRNKEGEVRFGCRQTSGPEYTKLYEWLSKNGYICSSDDWPWDYFYFRTVEDQYRFEQIYESVIQQEGVDA